MINKGSWLYKVKAVLNFFMVVAFLLVSGCAGINADGGACNEAEGKDCDIYIPFFTPVKIYIKSIGS